jgi:hypothetical protein
MSEPTITLIIPSAALGSVLTIGGQFLLRWLGGKGDKPAAKSAPCQGCPFHDDHEERIRRLEAHRARMEEALPDIRNDLRDLKTMLNTLLLRFGAGGALGPKA